MNLRWLKPKDFAVVLEIEKQSFPDPWTKQDFHRVLDNKNCICRVAEEGDELIGYMVYEYNSTSYNIVNLAVARHYRRHGVAKFLVSGLMSQMSDSCKHRILVSVSDRNLGAQLLFKSLGFRAEKISRNFFGADHNSYDFRFMKKTAKKETGGLNECPRTEKSFD